MRKVIHLAGLAFKQVTRHRVRSLLTIAGGRRNVSLFTAVKRCSLLRAATRSMTIRLLSFRERFALNLETSQHINLTFGGYPGLPK